MRKKESRLKMEEKSPSVEKKSGIYVHWRKVPVRKKEIQRRKGSYQLVKIGLALTPSLGQGGEDTHILLYSDVAVWAANCIRAVERDMRGDLGAGDQRGRRQELAGARRKLCPPAKFKWPPSWTKGQ